MFLSSVPAWLGNVISAHETHQTHELGRHLFSRAEDSCWIWSVAQKADTRPVTVRSGMAGQGREERHWCNGGAQDKRKGDAQTFSLALGDGLARVDGGFIGVR